MRIYFPRSMVSEVVTRGFREMGYRAVAKEGEFIVYEGVFQLKIPAETLGMSLIEFARLCRMIRVEGGRKKRRGSMLFIEPIRKRRLSIRLTNDEYDALVKVAESKGYTGRSLSKFFRDTLLLSLSIRLEGEG